MHEFPDYTFTNESPFAGIEGEWNKYLFEPGQSPSIHEILYFGGYAN